MKNKQRGYVDSFVWATMLCFLCVFVGLVAGIFKIAEATCERQWARSGLKSEWGVVQGCIVQRKDGTWVPASAIRDMTQ